MKQSNRNRFAKIRELARVVDAISDDSSPENAVTLRQCHAGIVNRSHELERLLLHVETKVNEALADNANGSPRDARATLLSLLSDL